MIFLLFKSRKLCKQGQKDVLKKSTDEVQIFYNPSLEFVCSRVSDQLHIINRIDLLQLIECIDFDYITLIDRTNSDRIMVDTSF